MRFSIWGVALGLFVSLAGGGCGVSSTTAVASRQMTGAMNRSLVMLAPQRGQTGDRPAWRVDSGGWEYGRNDELLNAGRAPLIDEDGWALIRTSDRTRTSDGRPTEFSSTYVRTVRTRRTR